MLERWRETAGITGSGWLRWISALVSLAIVGIAAVVLFRVLGHIRSDAVLAAIQTVRARDIALAGLFATGSYFTLTLYDLFALRTIGRTEIPYRTAAIAGFTSYSIGHNLGATALTSSMVRYHIYSTSGLGVTDVAKICFLTGLTFWLGNICVLGFGIALDPRTASAIDQLPPILNRGLGMSMLVACVGYLIWVSWKPRYMGINRWTVMLPDGRSTVAQIAIGICDLTCCAAAMYVLMPDTPPIGYVTLMVVFVSALLLGYASHTPGGVGVFDATMLVALPQFVPEELIARLLIFRLVCYIIPGAIALACLGIRQLWLARRYYNAS